MNAGEFKHTLDEQLSLESDLAQNYEGFKNEYRQESELIKAKHNTCFARYDKKCTQINGMDDNAEVPVLLLSELKTAWQALLHMYLEIELIYIRNILARPAEKWQHRNMLGRINILGHVRKIYFALSEQDAQSNASDYHYYFDVLETAILNKLPQALEVYGKFIKTGSPGAADDVSCPLLKKIVTRISQNESLETASLWRDHLNSVIDHMDDTQLKSRLPALATANADLERMKQDYIKNTEILLLFREDAIPNDWSEPEAFEALLWEQNKQYTQWLKDSGHENEVAVELLGKKKNIYYALKKHHQFSDAQDASQNKFEEYLKKCYPSTESRMEAYMVSQGYQKGQNPNLSAWEQTKLMAKLASVAMTPNSPLQSFKDMLVFYDEFLKTGEVNPNSEALFNPKPPSSSWSFF